MAVMLAAMLSGSPIYRPFLTRTPLIGPNVEVQIKMSNRIDIYSDSLHWCQYQDYSVEDATYRNAVDFIEPAARLFVAKYRRNVIC
jgi:hypothetical protein